MVGVADSTGLQFAAGQAFYDHILTDWYLPVVADARNNASVLWNVMPKTSERVAGRFITYPVRTTRNIGVNTIRPTGKMPDPGAQGADTYAFGIRHLYGRIKIDNASISAASQDAGAYLEAQDLEVEGLMDDIVIQQQRMLHNDGSGRLAEINAGATSATQTLKLTTGIEGSTTCDTAPTKWIQVGMRLAFCASDGTSLVVETVQSITNDTVIVLEGSITTATGDWVVLASRTGLTGNADNSTGYRSEPMGIGGIFTDADVPDGTPLAVGQTSAALDTTAAGVGFQGIDSAAYDFNQSIVIDNSAVKRPLTETLMQQAFDDADEQNNGKVDLILSHHSVRRAYIDLLAADKRFATTELRGGHTMLDFNGVGWTVDKDCWKNRAYFLGLEAGGFRVYEQEPLGWQTGLSGQIWKWFENDDGNWAAMVARYNVGCDVRNRTGALLNDLDT